MKLNIGYLYPDLMNIYGDTGNVITLQRRCQWRGIEVKIINISVGNYIPTSQVGTQIDLFFFGGGQDQSQNIVANDLGKSEKSKVIRQEVERGVPLLSICGGYQLLGEYYQPAIGPRLAGVGIFPAYTVASKQRMIGNIVIRIQNAELRMLEKLSSAEQDGNNNSAFDTLNSELFLVGFENHSGKTYLKKGARPLGRVIKGFGNNGEDKSEGCIYKNAIGCYMHGSLLPKNPDLADWLIKTALEVKYKKEIELKPLDDTLENAAHQSALQKFS